jgi:hypothetical protein
MRKIKPIQAYAVGFIVAVVALFALIAYQAQAADVTYGVVSNATKRLADMGDSSYAEVTTGRTQYHSYLQASGITTDTYYVLVDLSDTTNYPHSATNEVIVTGWHLRTQVSSAEVWVYCVGVVTAIDGSGTTVTVFSRPFPDISATFTSYEFFTVPGSGIGGNDMIAADTTISAVTTSTDLASPAGTTQAEVGDIFVIADEITGSAGFTFTTGLTYWTK